MSPVNLSDNKDVIVQNIDPNRQWYSVCLFVSIREKSLASSIDQFLSKYTVLYNYH